MSQYKKFLLSLLLGTFSSIAVSFYMHPGSNNRIFMSLILVIPFSIAHYVSIYKSYIPFIEKYNFKKKLWINLFIVFYTAALLVSLLSEANYILPFKFYIKLAIYLGLFMIALTSMAFILSFILKIQYKYEYRNISRKRILIYSVPCIVIFSLYLIAFFPGVMTADSMSQWKQIVTHNFDDWHPFAHTFFNMIMLKIWHSPASIALGQILILSFVFAYGMYSLERVGVDKKVLYIATALFCISPVNGIMSITLWKDVLYSIFVFLFTILLVNVIASDGVWLQNKRNIVFFIITALLVMLFRHNGIVSFGGSMICLILLNRNKIKQYSTIFGAVFILFILIKGPLYKAIGVSPTSPNEAFGIPTQQIAGVIRYNGYISEEQKEKINRIMPFKVWLDNYVPCNVDYIKFNPNFNTDEIVKDKKGFLKLWFDVSIQNPKMVVGSYMDQTAIIWSIKEIWPTNGGTRTIYENSFGLEQVVINKGITYTANKLLDISLSNNIRWLFWRPALYIFILIFLVFASLIRNGKKVIIVLMPVLFNIFALMMAIPAQDFRYLYANTLIFLLVSIFSFVNLQEINV